MRLGGRLRRWDARAFGVPHDGERPSSYLARVSGQVFAGPVQRAVLDEVVALRREVNVLRERLEKLERDQ